MTYLGIDLHTRNMTICAVSSNGKRIGEWKLANDIGQLDALIRNMAGPVKAVVEATSSWYWLAGWAQSRDLELILAHAKMLKAIAYAKVKTDSVDAHRLAQLLAADLIPRAHMVMGTQRELRELLRGRLRLVWRRCKVQDSLYNLFFKYNVSIPKYPFRDLHRLEEHLTAHLSPASSLEAVLQIGQLRLLESQVYQIEENIDEYRPEFPGYDRISQLPGIGKVSSWSILAEVGDISRFGSDKHFASYCRLVPGAADSGGKRRHKSRNKDGNKYLKVAFSQAAIGAITYYPPVRQFYNKIRRRSGKHVARTVVAKELARIVYFMLSRNQPYKGFKGKETPKDTYLNWPHSVSPHSLRGRDRADPSQPDAI
ncbi:IS110 family transposase [Gracilimonas sp. BCB1]|uniref:IS110 family transposase n=1 Tax=Gracilimonas sp. BCB1 TaxID=3152362 RepID=UPI0032D981E2